MAYYYFVASLPRLSLDEEPPFSSAELVRMSEGPLSGEGLADLRRVVAGRPEEVVDPVFRSYVARETQLRSALAKSRAARAGVDPSIHMRHFEGFDSSVERIAAEAMAVADPLERELMLDRFRFHMLETLALPSSFELAVILAYAARLLLVERWRSFDEERGMSALRRIVDERVAEVTL